MSPGKRFTSMAEWPCFEAFGGPPMKREAVFGVPVWACGQGGGRVITGPRTARRRTPLQVFETLYMAVRSLPSFAGPPPATAGPNQDDNARPRQGLAS